MMDLFDFDFTQEQRVITDEEIKAHFEMLVQFSKELGNPYGLYQKSNYPSRLLMPAEITPYIEEFEKRGWIVVTRTKDFKSVCIKNELKDFETPEEIIERLDERLGELFLEGKYQEILKPLSPSCQFKDDESRLRYYSLQRDLQKSYARRMVQQQLGLSQFLNDTSVRGSKMERFSDKMGKAVIKEAAKDIIPIKDFDEMEHYFKTHAFYCGIQEYNARAECKTILVTLFQLVCLCEAEDEKTIALILSYTGGSWTNIESSDYHMVYPKGWSKQRYYDSLTPELIDKMFKDHERLARLHSRAVS